jgi:hypothetical protein
MSSGIMSRPESKQILDEDGSRQTPDDPDNPYLL